MNKIAQCFILLLCCFYASAQATLASCTSTQAQDVDRIKNCRLWITNNPTVNTAYVNAKLQLARWLDDANHSKEALTEMEQLLGNHLENIDKSLKWAAFNYAGEIAQRLRRHSRALLFFQEAALLADSDHKELLGAKTFLSLSMVLRKLGVLDFASEHAIRAYDIYFKYHEMSGMADSLVQLGHIYLKQNNLTQAEQALKQAIGLYEQQQLSIGRATAMIIASRVRVKTDDYKMATEYLLEAARALESTPIEMHYNVTIKLVRAMLGAKLYDNGLIELDKMNTEQLNDRLLVHYLVLKSQIYQAKNDRNALKEVDTQLAAVVTTNPHMRAHIVEERFDIAKKFGELGNALVFAEKLTKIRGEYYKNSNQEVSKALAQYMGNAQWQHVESGENEQLHFTVVEVIITCITMFLGGFGVNVLWNQLLAPRLFSEQVEDDFNIIMQPELSKPLPSNASQHEATLANAETTFTQSAYSTYPSTPIEPQTPSLNSATEAIDNPHDLVALEQAQKKDDDFRFSLVELMNLSLNLWQQQTQLGKVELAEQSGIWKVTIDDGRLRTRALERYLKLERLPKHPRWREVLRTGYFVLGQLTEGHQQYSELNVLIQNVQKAGKYQSFAPKAVKT